MGQRFRFVCNSCDCAIEAWEGGHPYYVESVVTKTGAVKQRKRHVNHPRSKVRMCVGSDSLHVCLSCGNRFVVDSEAPITVCPQCRSSEIVDAIGVEQKSCPYCRRGTFEMDPSFHIIS